MRQAAVTCAVLAAATIFAGLCQAQSAASNDPDEARIEDVITASHILTNEGILDSFGHVSARSAKNPDHFFMPRAMPPALVSRADIVEVVHTHLNEKATMLVIEWWTPAHGLRRTERE